MAFYILLTPSYLSLKNISHFYKTTVYIVFEIRENGVAAIERHVVFAVVAVIGEYAFRRIAALRLRSVQVCCPRMSVKFQTEPLCSLT